MDYGAKMLQWAPFAAENTEPAGKLPTYGPAVNLGALNKVSDTPAFNEAKGYCRGSDGGPPRPDGGDFRLQDRRGQP